MVAPTPSLLPTWFAFAALGWVQGQRNRRFHRRFQRRYFVPLPPLNARFFSGCCAHVACGMVVARRLRVWDARFPPFFLLWELAAYFAPAAHTSNFLSPDLKISMDLDRPCQQTGNCVGQLIKGPALKFTSNSLKTIIDRSFQQSWSKNEGKDFIGKLQDVPFANSQFIPHAHTDRSRLYISF